MKLILSIFLTLSLSQAFAAETTTLTLPPADSTNTVQAAKPSTTSKVLKHIIAGWKSQNSSGRSAQMIEEHGRQVNAQQEVWLGYKHESGFGLYGLYAATYNQYKNDSDRSKWSMGDPSITLVHPAWYLGSDLKVFGKLRRYFAETPYSEAHGMRQTAYYVDMSYLMPHEKEIYNNTTFRMFDYSNHSASATKFYIEDTTNFTKNINKNWRYGVGQWTQYEEHFGTPTGYCVEVMPLLDYVISPKSFMGPRIKFPIVSENAVFDGPKGAKWNQAYFQFFVLMNL